MQNAAIILCGGSGSRMKNSVGDKTLTPLSGKPVFYHSFLHFCKLESINTIVFTYRDEKQKQVIVDFLADKIFTQNVLYVPGGKERQDSVNNALQAISTKHSFVFIHDGARPLLSESILQIQLESVVKNDAAVLAKKCSDTIKRTLPCINENDAQDLEDLDRSRLWLMETPQAFNFGKIKKAYSQITSDGNKITDDVAAFSSMGYKVALVENDYPNPKITHPSDLDWIEFLLNKKKKQL